MAIYYPFRRFFPLFFLLFTAIFIFIVINEGKSDMKKQEKRGQFCLLPKEINQLIDSAPSLRDRIVIKLLARCGLRRTEAVKIAVNDLDPAAGSLRVFGKGGKERIVPVPADLVQDVSFYLGKRRTGWLFQGRKGRALTALQINRIVGGAGIAAGLKHPDLYSEKINPHCLRHTFARQLKKAGVPIEMIAAVLGHESITTTLQEYGLPSVDEIHKKVLEVMGVS